MPNKQAKLRKQAKVVKKGEVVQHKKAQRLANKRKREELKKDGCSNIKIVNGNVIRYKNKDGKKVTIFDGRLSYVTVH